MTLQLYAGLSKKSTLRLTFLNFVGEARFLKFFGLHGFMEEEVDFFRVLIEEGKEEGRKLRVFCFDVFCKLSPSAKGGGGFEKDVALLVFVFRNRFLNFLGGGDSRFEILRGFLGDTVERLFPRSWFSRYFWE